MQHRSRGRHCASSSTEHLGAACGTGSAGRVTVVYEENLATKRTAQAPQKRLRGPRNQAEGLESALGKDDLSLF